MDLDSAIEEIRTVVLGQLALAGDDPAIAAAGEAILAGLEPAVRQAGLAIAEEAAEEAAAQLPNHDVSVMLTDGQPALVVRANTEPVAVNTEDLGARITVRLPEELKEDLEAAASDLGDSVNTFVVRALAGQAKRKRSATRSTFEGTIET